MSKKTKQKITVWKLALVPFDFDETKLRFCQRKKGIAQVLGGNITEGDRNHFYNALLKLEWLPSRVRGAILKEMGSSLRKVKYELMTGQVWVLREDVKEAEERIRRNGGRRGIRAAAIAEIADKYGMSSEALDKLLYRYPITEEQEPSGYQED